MIRVEWIDPLNDLVRHFYTDDMPTALVLVRELDVHAPWITQRVSKERWAPVAGVQPNLGA